MEKRALEKGCTLSHFIEWCSHQRCAKAQLMPCKSFVFLFCLLQWGYHHSATRILLTSLVLYPCGCSWTALACLDPKSLQQNIVSLTLCGCHSRFSVKKYPKLDMQKYKLLQTWSYREKACIVVAGCVKQQQLHNFVIKLWGCRSTAVLHPAVTSISLQFQDEDVVC